jgi:hypothetical protein
MMLEDHEIPLRPSDADRIKRTADGRPFILPPAGGKPKAYTRSSTFCRALEDGAGLTGWKQRMLLKGAIEHPDLIPADLDPLDYRGPAGRVIEELMDAAGAHDAANFGTACHAIADDADFKPEINPVVEYNLDRQYIDWLTRYRAVTAALKPIAGEIFVVTDEFKTAGTFDRIMELPDGRMVVADIKTGSLRLQEHTIQLTQYAQGSLYDEVTGNRQPLADRFPQLDIWMGVVIHVPAEKKGKTEPARLIPVDLNEGYRLSLLALQVRQSRSADVQADPESWRKAMTKREETHV